MQAEQGAFVADAAEMEAGMQFDAGDEVGGRRDVVEVQQRISGSTVGGGSYSQSGRWFAGHKRRGKRVPKVTGK